MIYAFVIGAASWPLVEYLIHYLLGHKLMVKTLFKKEHLKHHFIKNYYASAKDKTLVAIPAVLFTCIVPYYLGVPLAISISYSSGFIACYLFYEWIHRYLHVSPPRNSVGRALRRHHFGHHFMDPMYNQGVSTTIFDHIFKTKKEWAIIEVPREKVPDWMWNSSHTQISPKYHQDYMIKSS